ncbi:hypothetical protein RJ639_009315 [Escallonia herrerae]|uniref:Uncharacterized protein n=1 Tax=Escallonia herrerae TaxID=1293975 RepID=A0AA88VTC3_9ASTE|nr:hypothetical protein RJ639_009315 [Escallonia herrerae]
MRTPGNKRDPRQCYRFHRDHGHSMKGCNILIRKIESHIARGYLKDFPKSTNSCSIHKDKIPKEQEKGPLSSTPSQATLALADNPTMQGKVMFNKIITLKDQPSELSLDPKHPDGWGNAGGMHHHRILFDNYHLAYFGKVGMRFFHHLNNKFHCPVVDIERLWSLVPQEVREKAVGSGDAPVVDVMHRKGAFQKRGDDEGVGIICRCQLYFPTERSAEGQAKVTMPQKRNDEP